MVAEATGKRIALRPLQDEDVERLKQLIQMPADPGVSNDGGGSLAIERIETGELIGILSYTLGTPEHDWMTTERLVLADSAGHRGYGSEAVRLLEEVVTERRLASSFLAWVPKEDGLGLYFWLRLGYRPAGAGDPVWLNKGNENMMAMVREA